MMKKYTCYLVCKEHIKEVKKFLNQFFKEIYTKYTYEDWVTFEVPNANFRVNLMRGEGEELTQNITFETGADSLEKLKKIARKYNCKVDSFVSTESEQDYTYYYFEIHGPENICKIIFSYVEDIK